MTANPYTLSGLTAGTTYDWYVRADCGGGNQSPWAGPVSFTTSVAIPWTEGFENMTSVGSGIYPPGMTGDGDWSTTDMPLSYNRSPHTGTHYIFTSYNADDWLFSPGIYLTGGTSYDFSFWYITDGNSGWTTVKAKFGTGQSASEMTTLIGTPVSYPDNTTYVEFKGTFTPGVSGTYYIGLHVVSTYDPWFISFDDFSCQLSPPCPQPTAQTESNITTTSADLGWTPGGSETTWDIEWGPAGFTQGSGTTVTGVTSNPYALTGLTAGTTYDWYMRADCGDDQSAWTGPGRFSTECATDAVPWSEDFEELVSFGYDRLPNCMDQNGSWETADSPLVFNRSARSGTKYIYDEYDVTDWLFTPALDLDGGTSYDFSFWYKTDGLDGWDTIEAKYGTGQSEDDMTDAIGTPVTNVNNTHYVEFRGSFTPADTGTYYLGIHLVSDDNPWYISFDDLLCEVTPSCLPPPEQTTTGITPVSAQLNWTPGGSETTWNIEWGPRGFTPSSGTTITGLTSSPYTLTGLSPGTEYDWYVQADCGGDQSSWSGPSKFKTEFTHITAFPWTEDFEDNGDMPSGWSQEYVWDMVNWNFQGGGHEGHPDAAHGGAYNAFFYSDNYDDETKLITPPLDLTGLSHPVLSFWHTQTNWYSDQDTLRVYYKTSLDGTWTLIPGQTYINKMKSWIEETDIPLPNPGSDYYIAFDGTSGYGYGICVDDVTVKEGPSCPIPTAQTETNITATSADLGWIENGSATSWDIEWGPTGFIPGQGTTVNGVSSNPYHLSGLSCHTTYDWYVRADCGNSTSAWQGPATFSTLCDTSNIPYTENFDAVSPPAFPQCMEVVDANEDGFTWETYTFGFSYPNSATISYNYDDYWTGKDDWFFTQALNLTGGKTYQVSFVYRAGLDFAPESLSVDWGTAPDPSAMSGSPLSDLNDFNNVEWLMDTASITPATSGVYYIGFHADTPDNEDVIYIDDIKVVEKVAATTWTGAVDDNWDKAGNWTNGPPSATTDVTIPAGLSHYPTLTAATEIGSLTIESNASGDASILNDTLLIVNGNATVQRYVTGGMWHDITASTQGQTLNCLFFNHNPDVWLRHYNEPDDTRTYLTDLSNPMDPGAGFEIWVETGHNVTINYTGALQRSDVTLTTTSSPPISYSGPDPLGYNLIGNPFASPIDLDEGLWVLKNVSHSFWVWDPNNNGDTYRDWNNLSMSGSLTDGVVPMGQGFFIHATGPSPSITIPVDARVHSTQNFYKNAEATNGDHHIPHLSLRAVTDNGYDEMNIVFDKKATEKFEKYDTRKMFAFDGNMPQIYSQQDGELLSINCVPPLNEEGYDVKVGYRPGVNGEQRIEAGLTFLPDTKVLLEDLKTGDVQDLTDDPVYWFEGYVNDDQLRFILHFNPVVTGIDNKPGGPEIKVYAFDGTVYIRSVGKTAKEKKEVWIYDMFGRTVLETPVYPSTLNRIPLKQKKCFSHCADSLPIGHNHNQTLY